MPAHLTRIWSGERIMVLLENAPSRQSVLSMDGLCVLARIDTMQRAVVLERSSLDWERDPNTIGFGRVAEQLRTSVRSEWREPGRPSGRLIDPPN